MGNIPKIGISIPRFDAVEKVTGKAEYAADINIDGMLYGAILRSPYPHAIISEIDASKAKRIPGIVTVLTHEDIPGSNRIGPVIKDQPVLCDTKVRYAGEPVAVVAGISLEACQEALNAIKVYYEELRPVFSPEEALLPDAPLIHEKGNLVKEIKIIKGDVQRAISKGDIVVRNSYKTPFAEHAYLEPDAAIGYIDENDRITILKASQHLHHEYEEVVLVLGVDHSKVRVQQVYMGGGFGSKMDSSITCLVALLVFKTKKPVKIIFSRDEVFAGTIKRHPYYIDYTTVAGKDGKLKAIKVDIIANSGAYAAQSSGVIQRGVVHAAGPYEIPNIEIRGRAVYTNSPVTGAMRGYGAPQIAFACETQMDIVARELGIDPVEFRLLNCLKNGAVIPTGQVLSSSVSVEETLIRAREYVKSHPLRVTTGDNKKLGCGVACMFYGIGRTANPNPGRAKIILEEDGSVSLLISTVEMGTGVSTIMRQIAAEELGVNTEDVAFCPGDTDYSPDSGTTTATRVTYIVGNAVKEAARKLKEIIKETAAKKWRVDVESIEIKGREVHWLDSEKKEKKTLSLGDIHALSRKFGLEPLADGYYDPEVTPLSPLGEGKPYNAYTFATQIAEVELDNQTGKVDVIRIVASHDVGKAIHPQNVEGQIQGGISMGIGYATSENLVVKNGSIVNKNFTDYHIPTAMDVGEIIPIIVESPEVTGPFGAKGVGEPACVPTAPAITNSIYDATGIRIYELPGTPENIFKAFKRQKMEV